MALYDDHFFRQMFESPQFRDYQQRNPNAYVPPTENVSTNIPPFPSTGGNTRGRAPPGNQQGESIPQQAHGTHQMTPNAHVDYRGRISRMPSSSSNQGHHTEAHSSQSYPVMARLPNRNMAPDQDIPVEPRSMNIISGQVSGARPHTGELFLIEGGAVGGVQTKSKCSGKRKTPVQKVLKKRKKDEANDQGMSDDSEDDDNAFEFILLKEHQPSQAPVANELITLSNSGLGKVIIEIHVTNTVSDVYNSIKKAYPILNGYKGGLEMSVKLQQGTSRSRLIKSFDTPILSGMQLHEINKSTIYLSRIINHPFPPAFQSSGCLENCPNCNTELDVSAMERHYELCLIRQEEKKIKQEESDSSEPRTELLDSASESKPEPLVIASESETEPLVIASESETERFEPLDDIAFESETELNSESDHESVGTDLEEEENENCSHFSVPEFQLPDSLPYPEEDVFTRVLKEWEANKEKLFALVNLLHINACEFERCKLRECAHRAAQDPNFMRFVKNPLVASLKDELALDGGGVLRHVISILMVLDIKGYDLSIKGVHVKYMENRLNRRARKYFTNELFAMGVFAGIAITQLQVFPFFVRGWMNFLMRVDTTHPFLLGLDKFGIVEFARKEKDFTALFIPIPFTFAIIRPMLTLVPGDLVAVQCEIEKNRIRLQEELCFQLFVKFVQQVSDGLVNVASGPLTLKEIFQFATGSFIIPRQKEPVTISVQFVPLKGTTKKDGTPTYERPTADTCFNSIEIPLIPPTFDLMKELWVSAFETDGLTFHRN